MLSPPPTLPNFHIPTTQHQVLSPSPSLEWKAKTGIKNNNNNKKKYVLNNKTMECVLCCPSPPALERWMHPMSFYWRKLRFLFLAGIGCQSLLRKGSDFVSASPSPRWDFVCWECGLDLSLTQPVTIWALSSESQVSSPSSKSRTIS